MYILVNVVGVQTPAIKTKCICKYIYKLKLKIFYMCFLKQL